MISRLWGTRAVGYLRGAQGCACWRDTGGVSAEGHPGGGQINGQGLHGSADAACHQD